MTSAFKRAVAGIAAFVGLWAALIGLAIAPTPATAVEWLAAQLTGATQASLAIALLASLAANIVLLARLVLASHRVRIFGWEVTRVFGWEVPSAVRRPSALQESAARTPAPRAPTPSWLPRADGSVSIDNGTLENAYAASLAAARTVGPDAEIGLQSVHLNLAFAAFTGFTEAGRKKMWIAWSPDGPPDIWNLQRADRPEYELVDTQHLPWRVDATWPDLIAQSWLAESPFAGEMLLAPRSRLRADREGLGLWEVDYEREEHGVKAKTVTYCLINGQLDRTVSG